MSIIDQSTEVKVSDETTEIRGVFQGDLIIRSLIIQGIQDLRSQPWLLDHVFADLARDESTKDVYGTDQIRKAKNWFMKNRIQVIMDIALATARFPAVTISPSSSAEEANVLSDTHYEPGQNVSGDWEVVAGPLTPTHYDPDTGIMTLDPDTLDGIVLAPRMRVVTKTGEEYEITEASDENQITIDEDLAVDFGDMQIKTIPQPHRVSIESVCFKETYDIGCHVTSEPVFAIYLHSIIVFILLRYRQYLESRNFERSSIQSGGYRRDDQSLPETIYTRYIKLTGSARVSWPKDVRYRITSVLGRVTPVDEDGNLSPVMDLSEEEQDVQDDPETITLFSGS